MQAGVPSVAKGLQRLAIRMLACSNSAWQPCRIPGNLCAANTLSHRQLFSSTRPCLAFSLRQGGSPDLLAHRSAAAASAYSQGIAQLGEDTAAGAQADGGFLASDEITFSSLGLSTAVAKALEASGFVRPAQVQVILCRDVACTCIVSHHDLDMRNDAEFFWHLISLPHQWLFGRVHAKISSAARYWLQGEI